MQLWFAVRAVDTLGRGCAEFDLRQMAASLGRGVSTVQRYLRDGLKLRLFRSVNGLGAGQYRVYYAGLHNVCRRMQISNFGAVVEVTVGDLRHMRFIAAEAQAQHLQKCSRFKAQQKHKRGLAKPGALLSPSHYSVGVRGKVLHHGRSATYVSEDFIPFGTKQSTIAKSLGRSDRTIRRRLSNDADAKHGRIQKGLPKVVKRQLIQAVQDAVSDRVFVQAGGMFEDSRVFFSKGRYWKRLTNIYASPYRTLCMKASRHFLNKKVAKDLEQPQMI
ncbi:hypothetical protein H6F86_20795 [Phormidium sp. FACHB-592]|uniref:Uncharacterized protein n=1 Tax=Stenomitos frigidus AS-A4 TaxID=2933935 RepID=A0ABV0KF12_9CYAN|nr:hypothetical protein [Phormidium sp. FACHB-592]MBD2076272.1 hypothetical protein [Phormidium sp. FACHB-592]